MLRTNLLRAHWSLFGFHLFSINFFALEAIPTSYFPINIAKNMVDACGIVRWEQHETVTKVVSPLQAQCGPEGG